MKTMAKILSIVMILSMISVPVYAETTTSDDMIEYFADKVIGMSDIQSDAYFDLLKVIIDLNDPDGLLAAYNTAVNSMAGSQQTKLVAMKKVLDNLSGIGTNVLDATFTYNDFKSFVEGKNKIGLVNELKARRSAFDTSILGLDKATIDLGFDRMKSIFEKQVLAGLIGKSFILVTTSANGRLYVYEDGIAEVVRLANAVSDITIEITSLRAGVQQLADYYNSSSQKSIIYSYFFNCGLIIVDSTFVAPGAGTGTNPGTGTGTTPGTTTGITPVSPTPVDIAIPDVDLGEDDPVAEGTALFGDIGRFTWAWTAIRQLYIAEVIKGKSKTEFDPSGDITRAEFSALLTRLLETSIPTDTPTLEGIFDDVNNNKWYYNEVMAAFKAGFVRGKAISIFDPNAKIDREQIATILSRVLVNSGIKEIESSEINSVLNEFADVDKVSTWAKSGAAMIADLGIITGVNMDNKKYFNFKENASRAEVSVMLYRLAELIETKVTIVE